MELVNDRWTKGQTMKRGLLCALLWANLISTQGQGTMLWDEAVNGPLSEDYFHPTQLPVLQTVTNSLFGVTEVVRTPPYWVGHPNEFTVTVTNGMLISKVFVKVDKPNVWAWIGDADFGIERAFTLNTTDGDLLSQWGLPPLSEGTYGIYLENHDHSDPVISIATFRLDFVVEAIPEPASVSLLLVGLSGLGFRNWRKP